MRAGADPSPGRSVLASVTSATMAARRSFYWFCEAWAVDFSGNFWAGVTVASVIATGLAVLLSAWWRRVDRAAVEWAFFDGESRWSSRNPHGDEDPPHATCAVANVGPGHCFRLQAVGAGCLVTIETEPRHTVATLVPVLISGERVTLRVYCEPGAWGAAQVMLLGASRACGEEGDAE